MGESYARRFGYEMTTQTKLYMDKELATLLAKRDGSFEWNERVMTRTNFIREGIEQGAFKPMQKSTTKMPADCRQGKRKRLLKVDMLAADMTEIPTPK